MTSIIPVKVICKKMSLNGIGYHKLNLLTALRPTLSRIPLPWQQITMLACNARIDQVIDEGVTGKTSNVIYMRYKGGA